MHSAAQTAALDFRRLQQLQGWSRARTTPIFLGSSKLLAASQESLALCRRWSWATNLEASCSRPGRSEEHTSELQSLMRISHAVFCLQKKLTDIKANNISARQRIK